MILGTADVFSVDPRTAALIKHRLRNADLDRLDETLTLAALTDFCIYEPPYPSEHLRPSIKIKRRSLYPSSTCSVHHLAKAIQRRDPLGIGYSSDGIDLLHRMLKWKPNDRITLRDALSHAYFVGPYVSSLDGSEHMTAEDLRNHDSSFRVDTDVNVSGAIENSISHGTSRIDDDELEESQENDAHALVASYPPFKLETNPADMCIPANEHDEWFTIQEGSCDIAKGIRHLMGTGKYENEKDMGINKGRSMPFVPSRYYYTIDNSWRGNFLNTSSTLPEFSEIKNESVLSVPYHSPMSMMGAPLGNTAVINQNTNSMLHQCSKCSRTFSDWESCHRHSRVRKHGLKCRVVVPATNSFNNDSAHNETNGMAFIPAMLPSCLSTHSLLDVSYDPSSGWCDLQGRRAHLEDTHAIRFETEYKFFGVFDGMLVLMNVYYVCLWRRIIAVVLHVT